MAGTYSKGPFSYSHMDWLKVAAIIFIGGKVAAASPASHVEEMSYALSKAEAKYLMTTQISLKVAGIPR